MASVSARYNNKNPGVKRLMREALELSQPSENYYAQPLEDNLFEWHFTIRGPPDSDFEGGLYHGRIILPTEYPMKPPSIMLLTPNGRFETGKKICLSMSAHHPETWRPSWSIRTVLVALIGFMPSPGNGAIGSLDYTREERQVFAKKSGDWPCNVCNVDYKSVLLNGGSGHRLESKETTELAKQISFKGEPDKDSISSTSNEISTQEINANRSSVSDHQSDSPNSNASSVSSEIRSRNVNDNKSANTNINNTTPSQAGISNSTTIDSQGRRQDSSGSLAFIQWFLIAVIAILIARRLLTSNSIDLS